MLRVSDGQFTSDIILNLIDVTDSVSEIVGASVIQPQQSLLMVLSILQVVD